MGRPVTFDHLKSRKKPMRDYLWIAMDPEIAKEYEEAAAEFNLSRLLMEGSAADPELKVRFLQAEKRHKAAEAALQEDAVKFVFVGVGRKKYEAILDKNQPTADQQAAAKPGRLNWHPEKFPPALVDASLVEPELTSEEFREIWNSDDWNNAELTAMFEKALYVNANYRTVSLGEDFGGTNGSSKSSTTASRTASRTASS